MIYRNKITTYEEYKEELKFVKEIKFEYYMYDEIHVEGFNKHDFENTSTNNYFFVYGVNLDEYGNVENKELLFHMNVSHNYLNEFNECINYFDI